MLSCAPYSGDVEYRPPHLLLDVLGDHSGDHDRGHEGQGQRHGKGYMDARGRGAVGVRNWHGDPRVGASFPDRGLLQRRYIRAGTFIVVPTARNGGKRGEGLEAVDTAVSNIDYSSSLRRKKGRRGENNG